MKAEIGNMKAKFGTVDKRAPKSVYIEYGTYIQPKYEMDFCKERMKDCETDIRKMISDRVKKNENFGDNFIFVFDVPSERIETKKKTYLSIQIYLKVIPNSEVSTLDFKTMAINYLVDDQYIFEESEKILVKNGFSCSKKKK